MAWSQESAAPVRLRVIIGKCSSLCIVPLDDSTLADSGRDYNLLVLKTMPGTVPAGPIAGRHHRDADRFSEGPAPGLRVFHLQHLPARHIAANFAKLRRAR